MHRERGTKGFLSSILLILVSTLSTLAVGELFLRVFAPQIICIKINEVWRDQDAELPYVPKKNLHSRIQLPGAFNAALTTNGDRLRGARDYSSVTKNRRILFFGDSFVFGWGVDDDKTLPACLERLLSGDGKSVEVLNAGVYGYDVPQYVKWQKRFSKFRPNLTILGFCLENDFYVPEDPTVVSTSETSQKKTNSDLFAQASWIRKIKDGIQRLHIVVLIRNRLYTYFPQIRKCLFAFGVNDKRNIFLNEYPESLKRQVNMVERDLHLMKQEAERWGGRFMVVGLPLREQIYSSDVMARSKGFDPFKPEKVLGEICAAEDIEFYDMVPDFIEKAKRSRSRFFFEIDPHFSPAGNDAAAVCIAKYLSLRDE